MNITMIVTVVTWEKNQQAQVVINSPAETPHEAEEKAISQCSSTCSSSGTYQGPGEYKGKKCKVYQKRRVISARAQ